MRGIPCRQMVKVLTNEQVEMIHEASLEILERTGVRFDNEDARQRLVRAGAVNHPFRKAVVTFPRSVVDAAIRRTPREVTCFARDPDWDIKYDGEHTFPYALNGNPKTIDSNTVTTRPSTYADVEDAARLGDALDNNHLASHMVIANDAPPEMAELKTMEAAMKHTAKAMSHHATSAKAVDFMVKMWSCVAGGNEEFRKRPLFSLAGSPTSPLTYANHLCEVLMRSAELRIPFSIVPCPISGGTGPITLGGSLALQNAEILSGLVLIQDIAPSLPSVYSGRVCFMDTRTGRDLWGVPEEGLVSAAIVQLAKRYRMVSDTCGMGSDVTRWDAQTGFERMMTALVPTMAGADSMSGMGDGWEGASSLEMLVIDNDVFDDIARITRGVAVDDELDLDLLSNVGTMTNTPEQHRSMSHLRRGERGLILPHEMRASRKAPVKAFKPLLEAARARVQKILREHTPMPLDRGVETDIEHIMKEARNVLVR